CECLSGLCGFPVCEVGSTPRIVSRGDGTPGKCCDVFECVNETKPACVFNNEEYDDGDMFRMDSCRFCRCQGGVSICFTAQCGELNCERYYVPEGECCPVCEDPVYPFNNPAGCYANGQIRAHGDRWREDDCTFCQCINGEPHCVATACGQSCMNPVKVPGECCPVCEVQLPTSKVYSFQRTNFVEITHPSHVYSSHPLKAVLQRRKKEWTEIRMMVYGQLYERGRLAETEVEISFPENWGQSAVTLKSLRSH
ncbi:hypothetical protein GH733_009021, partial [Mirounga leonina]